MNTLHLALQDGSRIVVPPHGDRGFLFCTPTEGNVTYELEFDAKGKAFCFEPVVRMRKSGSEVVLIPAEAEAILEQIVGRLRQTGFEANIKPASTPVSPEGGCLEGELTPDGAKHRQEKFSSRITGVLAAHALFVCFDVEQILRSGRNLQYNRQHVVQLADPELAGHRLDM